MHVLLVWLMVVLVQAPQNPSPMSDSTRPHPRVARDEVPGRRSPLTVGTLYLPERFNRRAPASLLVHFHGAPWLVEHHVRERAPRTALVTVQLGAGSRVYADAFKDPAVFAKLIDDAATHAGVAGWKSIAVSSFSAGYGAVRSILQAAEHYARIEALTLADSLHASYAAELAPARAVDLPVDESSLQPFMRFAADAAAGRRRMRVTHSEVFPGTFASTTETADVLLRHLQLPRRRVLRAGPIGMQQLSEARRGNFHLAGYAGNSAPDHMDHLYALPQFLWK